MVQPIAPSRLGVGAELSLEHVSISFRGVHALRDVSFEVRPGSVTALIGPNGAGKTTLFNCISGLYRSGGTIRLDGRDISTTRSAARARLGVARTFQTPALVAGWSVLANVVVGDCARGAAGPFASFLQPGRENRQARQAHEQAADLLETFGLAHLSETPVDGLPHAQRRRVEIVRALLPSPRLLLLDEPAAGLGNEESFPLFDRLLRWAEGRDMTVLLVEHSMDLVMKVAGHVVVLDAGGVIADGAAEEVRQDPAVIKAYLGE
ncbi:ABC transporter ATP-binding protein [Geodermatophilus ruber]|uniref:Branched-chain amino acid transport system ATP-binding protein n=1 Tax=Geodermatophilus ruber TaxID=504800 RepID=A0A1I4BXS9_9ACTN|nr:ABC transporter ATP-binding protein [Geodermatophilus ruber]SFK73604.1 branched-chain amino acid transport system ATP-binding protein [Geodermatophilus ruber]